MKRITFFSGLCLFFAWNASLLGVTAEQAQREILVYVRTDTTIIVPPPSISATLSQTTINYQPLRDTLEHYPVELIEKSDPNFNRADTIAYDSAGRPIQLLDLYRLFRIRLVPSGNLCALKQALDSVRGEVIFSEINGIGQFLAVEPEDDLFPRQWGLKNTGQAGGTYGEDIKATEAWDIFQGSSNVKIGIIDTGIDSIHPDLSGRTQGAEAYTPSYPVYWHGTHVAGIAAASANNFVNGRYRGVAGVDWNAKIIAKNISTFDGPTIYSKIVAAVNQGANVLNHSWGFPGSLPECQYPYQPYCASYAFALAYRQNRVSVAAMGNSGFEETFYPAGLGPGIIAVGALQNDGNYSTFSTRGNHIDVSAPGGISASTGTDDRDVLSTVPKNTGTVSDGVEYSYASLGGTSMAAPFVTGLASLLKGFKPNLSNDDIENIIKLSADDRGPQPYGLPPGWDKFTGYGRINARRALELLQTPYVFLQQTATGGTVAARDTNLQLVTFGAGLQDGRIVVFDRYEIRKTVSFPITFYTGQSPLSSSTYPWPAAWGRGVSSIGRPPAGPDFDIPYCEVVPGTLTPTGCQLKTFVYWAKYYLTTEEPINRWLPVDTTQAVMAYSVLGEPVLSSPAASLTYPELAYICSPDSGCRWRVKGVRLNFSETNTIEEGMEVERKDATNNYWGTFVQLPPNATTWTDEENLKGSETYTYRIKVFTRNQAVSSNEMTVKIPPKPPVGVHASIVWVEQCGGENFSPLGGGGEVDAVDGGGEEPNLPPGCETVPTNKVILSWSAPSTQNLAVPIVRYRVDAFWKQNRTVTCPCPSCGPLTQLWETFEQSDETSAIYTRDTLCLQHTDTAYNFYLKAFDTAGDSSLVWVRQACPPDSQLVVARTQAQSGSTCVTQCCNVPAPRIVSTGSNIPEEFTLEQNFPNPFNPTSTIRYALPLATKVELKIYNILGQVVRKLVDEEKPAGLHQAVWDGKDEEGRSVSTGIYLYQIRAGDFVQTKKMQLRK